MNMQVSQIFSLYLIMIRHISRELIKNKLKAKEIIIAKNQENQIIGWLRYGYFLGQHSIHEYALSE